MKVFSTTQKAIPTARTTIDHISHLRIDTLVRGMTGNVLDLLQVPALTVLKIEFRGNLQLEKIVSLVQDSHCRLKLLRLEGDVDIPASDLEELARSLHDLETLWAWKGEKDLTNGSDVNKILCNRAIKRQQDAEKAPSS